MKITLLFFLTPFLSLSQQALKKVTEYPTEIRIELYTFRNGDSPENIVGNYNFSSQIWPADRLQFRNQSGDIIYNWNSPWPPEFANSGTDNETICNNIFSPPSNGMGGYFNSFSSSGGQILSIRVMELPCELDASTDNNVSLDLYKVTYDLPKTLANGSPVPINTWFICKTRSGADGTLVIENKRIGFQFNGITWIEQTHDWAGNNFDIVNSVCTNLGISELENKSFNINIFPLPASENITVQNYQKLTGNIIYKIYDIMGRIIKSDKSAYNEAIMINELTPGNYLIQIIDESAQILTKKIIKK